MSLNLCLSYVFLWLDLGYVYLEEIPQKRCSVLTASYQVAHISLHHNYIC